MISAITVDMRARVSESVCVCMCTYTHAHTYQCILFDRANARLYITSMSTEMELFPKDLPVNRQAAPRIYLFESRHHNYTICMSIEP